MEALHASELDVLVGSLTADSPWADQASVTVPYLSTREVVGVEPGESSPGDLSGVEVAVHGGDAAAGFVRRLARCRCGAGADRVSRARGGGRLAARRPRAHRQRRVPAGGRPRHGGPLVENAWQVRLERFLLADAALPPGCWRSRVGRERVPRFELPAGQGAAASPGCAAGVAGDRVPAVRDRLLHVPLGSSQALKAAWFEDLLSLTPPLAFLIAARCAGAHRTSGFSTATTVRSRSPTCAPRCRCSPGAVALYADTAMNRADWLTATGAPWGAARPVHGVAGVRPRGPGAARSAQVSVGRPSLGSSVGVGGGSHAPGRRTRSSVPSNRSMTRRPGCPQGGGCGARVVELMESPRTQGPRTVSTRSQQRCPQLETEALAGGPLRRPSDPVEVTIVVKDGESVPPRRWTRSSHPAAGRRGGGVRPRVRS